MCRNVSNGGTAVYLVLKQLLAPCANEIFLILCIIFCQLKIFLVTPGSVFLGIVFCLK